MPADNPETQPMILIEQSGGTATLTLNRPQALNALSPQMLEALTVALEALDGAGGARAIVITGAGRAFCAGADITVMAGKSAAEMQASPTVEYWRRIRQVSVPLVAAVNGMAYGGGCELALACDLIVASETARFAQPEIKLGIMPGAGGTQRLARAIGPYRAMELILTGEPLSALEAYQAGLVNRLVPPERCLPEAQALAALIAERPPLAVKLARQAVRHGIEHTLAEGMQIERANFVRLFDTADQKEGMAAFLERRAPEFRGQ